MPTEFHIRVRDLLEAAMGLPPAEREAYLQTAANGDGALLSEALALLPDYAAQRGRTHDAPWMASPTAFSGMAVALFDDIDWTPPFCIAPYTVVEILGSGGMGLVYRALDPIRSVEVAIKVLRRRLMHREDHRLFSHEQELLRQLKHPGIVRFLHGGVANVTSASGNGLEQRPYFVMELVRGKQLLQYAASEGLNILQRLDLLIQVCDALDYAHHRSVVHLDLKPDNIRVDPGGQIRILDFGISKLQCPDAERDRLCCAGTPGYAAPEQRNGQPVSPECDVYTLGIIAHELLTGARPAGIGERMTLNLSDVRLPNETRLTSRGRSFISALHAILSATLRLSGKWRYRDAGQLGADLLAVRRSYGRSSPWRIAWSALSRRGRGERSETHSRLLAMLLGRRMGENLSKPR